MSPEPSFGAEERALIGYFENVLRRRLDLHTRMTYLLLSYAQVRHMLDVGKIWDPELGSRETLLAA